jgi:hypothetical protein
LQTGTKISTFMTFMIRWNEALSWCISLIIFMPLSEPMLQLLLTINLSHFTLWNSRQFYLTGQFLWHCQSTQSFSSKSLNYISFLPPHKLHSRKFRATYKKHHPINKITTLIATEQFTPNLYGFLKRCQIIEALRQQIYQTMA